MMEIVKCFVTVKTTDNNCYKTNSSVETETCIESSVILWVLRDFYPGRKQFTVIAAAEDKCSIYYIGFIQALFSAKPSLTCQWWR